jgi:hypothetical protein
MVPRTHEPPATKNSFGQRRAVVSTHWTHGIKTIVYARQQNVRFASRDVLHLAVTQIRNASYFNFSKTHSLV